METIGSFRHHSHDSRAPFPPKLWISPAPETLELHPQPLKGFRVQGLGFRGLGFWGSGTPSTFSDRIVDVPHCSDAEPGS